MSHYTKGPWRVDPKRSLRVVGPNDETIASCGTSDTIRHQWEANARLAAAAPELLEALKALWSDIVEYNLINHMPNANNNHAMLQAVAAIAKAEETAA